MMWPFRSVSSPTQSAYDIALKHFGRTQIAGLTILERTFPVRIRPDLQLAIDAVLREFQIQHFCGVQAQCHEPASLSNCLTKTDEHVRLRCTPPQYQEVDVGDELPVRCLNTGLWMLNSGMHKLALLLSPASRYGETTGLRVEMAGLDSAPTHQVVAGVFRRIESAINQSSSYRGKILSLEQSEHDYRGRQAGIRVHRLRSVSREEIILPAKTLTLVLATPAATRASRSPGPGSVVRYSARPWPRGSGRSGSTRRAGHRESESRRRANHRGPRPEP